MAEIIKQEDFRNAIQPRIPVLERLSRGAAVYLLQALGVISVWYRERFPGSRGLPTTIKYYQSRPSLPIRIFFPRSYDPSASKGPLPTLFSLHSGGFCLGSPNDDDEWNERFANLHNVLVIALNYRKAPSYPFPTAPHDVEALLLSAFEDESLPIDKERIALAGFSAGANLSLSVSQLPSIRERVRPSAAIPVYAVVDVTIPSDLKVKTRYYKPGLGPGMRSSPTDYLSMTSPLFLWSYINPGTHLNNPLISPYFAPRDALPPHLFFVGAELDQLAHATWRMASKFAGRPEPTLADKVGQEEISAGKGELILDDERYAFEHVDEGGESSVRWLLVPDQLHGFDRLPSNWHGKESLEDAKLKEVAYQKLVGNWLRDVVWK
ncbi:hypothetical protein M426DRAFT_79359 [Hypoxylon sp. CI-4A]|nr:hypothetical protein M426DRAFT_79359 [Hypoxylon sp. CI-4A]